MSKGLIAFIVVAGIGLAATLIVEMKKAADNARKRSDEILRDFKTIDNSLKVSDSGIDASTRRLLDSLLEKTK